MNSGTANSGAGMAGVVLAGGRSRRMGGAIKGLLPLAGKPLLSHVIERVRPQVDELMLSVEQPSDEYAAFGLRQLADTRPDGGPLMGLFAAMHALDARHDWLLLVPCDAPFIPLKLADRLLARAQDSGLAGAVVRYDAEIQPTFSIWRRDILPSLERAVLEQNMAGLKQFSGVIETAELDWRPSTPSPFFNINDRAALLEAGRLLKSYSGEPMPC